MKMVFNSFILVFLLGNLVIRLGSIFNYPPYNGAIAGLLGAVTAACVFVVFRPRYLKHLLFIFGFSFFLFGFGSIDLQSRIFELLVTMVASTLFVINWRRSAPVEYPHVPSATLTADKSAKTTADKFSGATRQAKGEPGSIPVPSNGATGQAGPRCNGISAIKTADKSATLRQGRILNRPLVILILCYVALSAFSLLLLPVRTIVKDLWFFGFPDAFFYLFIGPPYSFYYPVAAVIRLMLFGVLGVEIARTGLCQENFKSLFSGIFAGAVFCAVLGLLDFYGVISLQAYRLGTTKSPGVLHSTFGNRGWFGEYILISVPFVLIGFMSRARGKLWKSLLFGSLIICEIALILAGGRAGWVSYPLILFICWLFFYYSQSDRLTSFRFSWKDLVKVGISVPITIAISFLLVFQVLLPFSDYLREETGVKGTAKESKQTVGYLKRRITGLKNSDPGSRQYTWGEGFNVGRESPVFGVGYESFCWHANLLAKVPDSHFNTFSKGRKIHQTPHNVFFSIFASGGVVGLGLWLIILAYSITILGVDLKKNKRLLNIPVIISIISFHTYGIFQSMQYIPMIWLMIFLCLGYAMTVPEDVFPGRFRRVMPKLVIGAVVAVGFSLFVYLYNFESRQLAEKYGLNAYAMEADRDRFAGFYQPSKRWKYGDYRWCGERGAIYFPEDGRQKTEGRPQRTDGRRQKSDVRSQPLVLEFHCRTPGLEKDPVVVKVFHEGEVVDRIVFSKNNTAESSPVPSAGATPVKQKKNGSTGQARQAKLKANNEENGEVVIVECGGKKGKKSKGCTVRRRYQLNPEGRGQMTEDPGEMRSAVSSENFTGQAGQGRQIEKLVIEVSRTWVPHEVLGNFDRREMGVGVKILKPAN